jgi:hypothetical protein
MTAVPGLIARFFIGAQHIIATAQGLILPTSSLEIQNRSRFLSKPRIARKKPVLVPPRLDRIATQNPPYAAPTDRFAQRLLRTAPHIRQRLAAQGLLGLRHHFTR